LRSTPRGAGQLPARRTDARRSRQRILQAARAAFADPVAEVPVAEIAWRSGVGSATLYRNFATSRALPVEEVDAVCAAAGRIDAEDGIQDAEQDHSAEGGGDTGQAS
jgi:AcrR family transcriptional regulator